MSEYSNSINPDFTPMVVSYSIHNILPVIVLHKVDFPAKEGPTTAILRIFLSITKEEQKNWKHPLC